MSWSLLLPSPALSKGAGVLCGQTWVPWPLQEVVGAGSADSREPPLLCHVCPQGVAAQPQAA